MPKTLMTILQNRYILLEKIFSGLSSTDKGVYKDKKSGKKVFIKIGNEQSSLEKEYIGHTLFYNSIQENPAIYGGDELNADLSSSLRGNPRPLNGGGRHKEYKKIGNTDVIIPKPLKIIDSANGKALVMEYISGAQIITLKKNLVRIKSYLKVLKLLETMNKNFDFGRSAQVITRTSTYQIVSLPYFLLKNVFFYPAHAPLFTRTFFALMRYFSKWLKLRTNSLCHGDINVGNVLVAGEKTLVIDFAHTCVSHCYYDLSQTLNSAWSQKGFHNLFWKKTVSTFRLDKREQDLLRSFVVFNLLQRLSQKYTKAEQEKFYLKRLEKLVSQL